MSKQTAVEWLIDEIRLAIENENLDAIKISKMGMAAKQMETKQIIQAFQDGVDSGSYFDSISYYMKTYK